MGRSKISAGSDGFYICSHGSINSSALYVNIISKSDTFTVNAKRMNPSDITNREDNSARHAEIDMFHYGITHLSPIIDPHK